jgi:hypothetical protein
MAFRTPGWRAASDCANRVPYEGGRCDKEGQGKQEGELRIESGQPIVQRVHDIILLAIRRARVDATALGFACNPYYAGG